MSFIETVPETRSGEPVNDMYESARGSLGYVPNYTKTFSHRPELYRAWTNLIKNVSGAMDPRRYELATMGAAIALRSSYCSLAHGEKLVGLGASTDAVRSLAGSLESEELTDQERAIVRYAAKIARSATDVIDADAEELRSLGLDDAEIFDVAAAAAERCFFSKLLDATGTLPDPVFRDSIPDLVDTLTVGRPIAEHD
jgi:uncharacterized peroxidase-related enzyme